MCGRCPYNLRVVNILVHTRSYISSHCASLSATAHSCGASDWRRTEHSTLRHCAAAWVRMCGYTAPIARRASGPYVTRGPVARMLLIALWVRALPSVVAGTWPLTSHTYKFYKHSFSSITLAFPSGVFSLRACGSNTTRELTSSYTREAKTEISLSPLTYSRSCDMCAMLCCAAGRLFRTRSTRVQLLARQLLVRHRHRTV